MRTEVLIRDWIEEAVLAEDEALTNDAYEKHTSGELTLEDLESIYRYLRGRSALLKGRWSGE